MSRLFFHYCLTRLTCHWPLLIQGLALWSCRCYGYQGRSSQVFGISCFRRGISQVVGMSCSFRGLSHLPYYLSSLVEFYFIAWHNSPSMFRMAWVGWLGSWNPMASSWLSLWTGWNVGFGVLHNQAKALSTLVRQTSSLCQGGKAVFDVWFGLVKCLEMWPMCHFSRADRPG